MKSTLKNSRPTLVFGTTPDYIKRISIACLHDTLFIIDKKFMGSLYLENLDRQGLIFVDLDNSEKCLSEIVWHLNSRDINPSGIGCFDCEALIDASRLALKLNLPFPSVESITRARSKFESKKIWKTDDIRCPGALIADSHEQTLRYFQDMEGPVVIKPLSASGSELVFFCENETEIADAVDVISGQLAIRKSGPFYKKFPRVKETLFFDPSTHWVIEEYIHGTEFSCDFVLKDDELTIVRLTEKVKDMDQTFGSVLAYCIPANLPNDFSTGELVLFFKRAVKSLGFDHGWFMVDFIINEKGPCLIEVTPRPGGDSIPDLIEAATGKDILGIYLDFVSGRNNDINPIQYSSTPMASLNIFAPKSGIITELDFSDLINLHWLKKIYISKKINDRIVMPPHDYDSRKIGHCIVESKGPGDLKQKQHIIMEKINLTITDLEANPLVEAEAEAEAFIL